MTSMQHLFGYLRAIWIRLLLLQPSSVASQSSPYQINAPTHALQSAFKHVLAYSKDGSSILAVDIVVCQHISPMEIAKLSVGLLFLFLFELNPAI
jgi:hypothetical protein